MRVHLECGGSTPLSMAVTWHRPPIKLLLTNKSADLDHIERFILACRRVRPRRAKAVSSHRTPKGQTSRP